MIFYKNTVNNIDYLNPSFDIRMLSLFESDD